MRDSHGSILVAISQWRRHSCRKRVSLTGQAGAKMVLKRIDFVFGSC